MNPKPILSSLKISLLCGALLVSAVGSVRAQNLPTLGDTAREELSPLQERKLGEHIMQVVRRDPDFIDDAVVSEYLSRLGNKLLDARPDARGEAAYNFEFFAVRDPVLNAFAFPGGFIGFHSALILAAQSESELASVMGHEIGHVAQRHIARMLGAQKHDALIPLAALALAVLAARSSPDAAMAIATGGQGLAVQRQLNFSRDAEREADRVGFQILRDAGFDSNGMVAFFGRLQTSTRNYNDSAPPYLRSHPLTSERIADIQARTLDQRYRQHADSMEFALVKARVRVLQDKSTQGLLDAAVFFEQQRNAPQQREQLAGLYGQALLAYYRHEYGAAGELLQSLERKIAASAFSAELKQTAILAGLDIDIKRAARQFDAATAAAQAALRDLPLSRGIVHQYADTLLAANQAAQAEAFLRDQIVLYRHETKLQKLLAEACAAQGKQAQQHIALAQAYALEGSAGAALQQLDIARREPDAVYFEHAMIDAFEREWKEKFKEELAEEKKQRK